MRWIVGLVFALALLGCGQQAQRGEQAPGAPNAVEQAAEGKRIALVIGNSAYQTPTWKLTNPRNDADLMVKRLQALGFAVTPVLDADRDKMTNALRKFGADLRAAGPNAVSVFFYAGHGAQRNGVNYLVPIDSDARTEDDIVYQAPPMQFLLEDMAAAGNAVNIVILDACRDMPLPEGRRTLGRGGLADMGKPANVFVAYATAPNQTAKDGAGANSPFTLRLADALASQAGEPIELLFSDVQSRVYDDTGGGQAPEYRNGLVRAPRWSFVKAVASADATPIEAAGAQSLRGANAAPQTADLLAGRWGSPSGGCDDPYQYTIDGDTLTITGAQWRSTARIGAERDGWLEVTALSPADMKDRRFSYRVDGATLTVQDGADAFTMQACR
jgi:hypothetical protein